MSLQKERQKKKFTAIHGDPRFCGIVDVASGDTTAVVSATQVKSGQNIMVGLGITSVGSHADLVCSPNSVVTNTSFVAQVNLAVVVPQQLWWMIIENF